MNTLNYSEQFSLFQSMMTKIDPAHYLDFNGSLFYIGNDGSVYSIDGGTELVHSIYLSLIVNEDFGYTKIFDNIELYSGVGNEIDIAAEFKNATQVSSVISTDNGDFSKRESTYYAVLPRDNDGITRLRDKFLLCNYSIKGISDSKDFSIPYIKTKYRYSII